MFGKNYDAQLLMMKQIDDRLIMRMERLEEEMDKLLNLMDSLSQQQSELAKKLEPPLINKEDNDKNIIDMQNEIDAMTSEITDDRKEEEDGSSDKQELEER